MQITRDPADDFNPDWSPDGSEIAFHSFRHGDRDVFVVAVDGRYTQEVVRAPGHQRGPKWQPDGQTLTFLEEGTGEFLTQRTGGRRGKWGTPKLGSGDLQRGPYVRSPDGRWVAYDARGRNLIVQATNGGPPRLLVDSTSSANPRGNPVWSADSRTIYFQGWTARDDAAIWSVPVTGGTPTALVRFTDPARQFYRPALVSDGRNFYFTIGSRESDIWVMELSKK